MQRAARKQEMKNELSDASKKRVMISVLVIALMLLTAFLQNGIESERKLLGLADNSASTGASAAFELLGGAKTTIAAFLWVKVDRVHDSYYGDLRKERELLPLFRIVTWLNPHIDEAYYVGSYMLLKFDKVKEAKIFNEEGLRMNPKSGRLELNKALFEIELHKDYKKAIPYLERSLKFSENMNDDELLISLQLLKASYTDQKMVSKAAGLDELIEEIRSKPVEEHEHEHDHEHGIWN